MSNTPPVIPDPATTPDPWTNRTFYLAVVAIMLSQGLTTFDNAGVSTLARSIQVDLGTTLTGVQYGIAGFLLFSAAFMMVAARLGAIWGRSRMLILGMVIRSVGTIVTAVAPNAMFFFLGRAVLGGIGTSLALVNGVAIFGTIFTGARRLKAASTGAAVAALASIAAPLVAGTVAGSIGWRWFYVICVAISLLGLAFVRLTPKVGATASSESIDLLGALLAVVSFGCIVFGIQQATPWGFFEVRDAPFTVLGKSPAPFIFVVGLLLLIGFGWFEHRRRLVGHPVLFDVRLIQDRFIRNGNLALLGLSSIMFGVTFLVPVYLQVVEGLSPFQSSLRTVFYGLGALTLSVFLPRIARRFAIRAIFTLCLAFIFLGLFTLGWEIGPLPWGATPVGMFLLGLALTVTKSPLNVAAQRAVVVEQRGQVGAMNESAWALGGALGVAIIGTILLATLAGGVNRLVMDDPALSADAKVITQTYLDRGVPFVPQAQVRSVLEREGLPPAEIDRLADHYKTSANLALLFALAGSLFIAIVTFGFVRRLPRHDPEPAPA